MKYLKLKISVFTIVAAFGIVVINSCANSSSEVNTMEKFSLVSPEGIVLANDLDDLKNIIVYNLDINLNKEEIKINDIRYSENDKVSFGIVDFISNAENQSMLVPLKIDDKFAMMVDGKNIYIQEISSAGEHSFDSKDTIFTNDLISTSQKIAKTAYVCNGGCCGWSQPNEDHFHCGCPATVSTELILSTSDGCVIQVIEDAPQQ